MTSMSLYGNLFTLKLKVPLGTVERVGTELRDGRMGCWGGSLELCEDEN